ncbi:MAG: phosphoglucosamine mutase [Syntrophomonadaceae bacterium]|nr:phosphoglucosamine mutase [Syntrophomonadaceae bacterium]
MTKVTLFGTDGVRGVANKDLTPELAYRLGRAGADVLAKATTRPTIAVGRDTRISGDMLQAALTAGLCSVGAKVINLGILPTPALAYLTKALAATAGVMISASHNHYSDNGIKFFAGNGYKLPDALELEIEKLVLAEADNLPRPTADRIGQVTDQIEAIELYLDSLHRTVNNAAGIKVVVDCANGAASSVAPRLLESLGLQVYPIFNMPDGVNINAGCGSTHPEALCHAVVEKGADLGLAFDGDADRVLAVDANGNLVDGDQILVAYALDLQQHQKLAGNTVVVTVMSNLGLFQALEKAGIKAKKTKVGDRYVLEEMLHSKAVLGGEQSGHIISLEHNTTGDGLLTGLQLIRIMASSSRSLAELAAQMTKFPQVLVNVPVKDKTKALSDPELMAALARAEQILGSQGRLLVRPSGTESLLRIMAEGPDQAQLERLVGGIAEAAKRL